MVVGTTPVGTWVEADEHALRFLVHDAAGLDLLFDGRRVWSFGALKGELQPDGSRVVTWPDPIRTRLDGRTTLTLRDSQTHAVLAEGEVAFGQSDSRVELVDSAGRPIALHKWGRLQRPFESMPAADIDAYLDFVETLMTVLREECQVEPFLAFGALLGAIRSGRLIGHDVDVDIGYFSEHTYPVDVMRETFHIERVLRSHGWRVDLDNAMFIQVFAPSVGGVQRNVDIFTCFAGADGLLYQANDVTTKGSRSTVLPTSQVEVEGRLLPAPHDPQAFLVAAYGPSWRVPDPTFSYGANAERRRLRGWTGGLREERARWRQHFSAGGGRERPPPSVFAHEVLPALRETDVDLVLDVGCGLGADTLFFADEGFDALGLDVVPSLLSSNRRAARSSGSRAEFAVLNLGATRSVLSVAARVARRPGVPAVFARGVVHELTDASQDGFWRFCAMVLRGGGRSYLEFEVGRRSRRTGPYNDRRPAGATPASVLRQVARFGAAEVHRSDIVSETELAGPKLCRLTLEWP